MKAYGLYRYHYTERGNRYSPTYYLGKQFQDLAMAGFISLDDQAIPEDRYTSELVPGVKKMRRFIDCTYDETKLPTADFTSIVNNVSSLNDIVMFNTVEEARQRIRDNTDLVEETAGKFLIHKTYTDPITGEVIPAKYLIIN